MPKLSGICLAVLVTLVATPSVAREQTVSVVAAANVAARIDSIIAPYYKPDEPGAAVIVVKDGKVVLRKAYGMADLDRHQPMTVDTSLRIGSITKQFTSTAILMLAEEGKLSLTDEITRFFPDYPTHGKKITVEHLLTHTSGIVSFTEKPGDMAIDVPVDRMIDSFKNDPLQFEPGTDWHYNNSGYFLLGAIIEKLSGQPYAKFLEHRIFVPLGMSHTAYEGAERGAGPRAVGYSPGEGGFVHGAPISMTQVYAAGALVSSAEDLARWDAAISSGRLLSADSWKRAFTPYRLASGKSTAYGYGWGIGTLQGVPMISHGGLVNGFRSFALRLPDEKVYVAVLTNAGSGLVDPSVVAMKSAAIAIDKPFPERKEIKLTSAALAAYTGIYQTDPHTTCTVRLENGQLVMQRSGRLGVPVFAFSETGFFVPGTLDYFEFSRNASGDVAAVTLHLGDATQEGRRVGDAPPERKAAKISNAAFDARAGRYEFAPNFVIELSREGDKFFSQATGEPRFEVIALSDSVFYSSHYDAELRFAGKPGGPSPQVVLSEGGKDMTGRKID